MPALLAKLDNLGISDLWGADADAIAAINEAAVRRSTIVAALVPSLPLTMLAVTDPRLVALYKVLPWISTILSDTDSQSQSQYRKRLQFLFDDVC